MSGRNFDFLGWIYAIGWLGDWAYWIAVGWPIQGEVNHVAPALSGWAPAFFWPLHALSELWQWVLA